MKGELVHYTLFDVGSELDLRRVKTLLGLAPKPAPLVTRSQTPPYAAFPQPLEVNLLQGPTAIELRVHQVGVVVVRVRQPFDVDGLASLGGLEAAARVEGADLASSARNMFGRLLSELRPAFVEPYDVQVEPESYTVFCLNEGWPEPDWMVREQRAALAEAVTGEPAGSLSPGLVESGLKHTFRYYRGDLIIVGWDNAIVAGTPGTYEDALDVIELANVELLEFRTYDAYLDQRLDGAFDAVDRLWGPRGLFRSAQTALRDVSALRVDFARLTDNLHDTGKFFGDWYLAKLHTHLREAFHLASWDRAVADKMASLEDMFQLVEGVAAQRRSLVLEILVVLLFVVDVVLLFVLGT